MSDPLSKEILDRCRRIETRLTRWLESQGVETRSMRPVWRRGVIHVHSIDTSLRDMLSVVPADWDRQQAVLVYLHEHMVMEMFVGDNGTTTKITDRP